MDYNRTQTARGPVMPSHQVYSRPHYHVAQNTYREMQGIPFEEEDDGFEFEQTAMAALKELEQPVESASNGKQVNWNRTSVPFELSPAAPTFEGRSFSNPADHVKQQQFAQPQANSFNHVQHQSTKQSRPAQMSQQASHQTQASGNPIPAKGGNWSAGVLPGAVIEKNDFKEMARFLLDCKGGSEAAALDFLRGVFLTMTNPSLNADQISADTHDWDSAVRNGPPYVTPEDQAAAQLQLVMNQQNSILLQAQRLGIPPRPPPISPITLLGDEIDQRLSTLVVLVPGRAHIVGHLIGKGGAEVGRIEREMSVTIKIEAASKMNVQLLERSVCIIGSVAAATMAQQFVSHKVHEKLLSEGVQAEVLKMIVPNEIVRHLIGKNGANINRLQNESGARTQVEPESTMSPGAVGRTIVLQGAERCRTFAQYLILRQIAEDRNVHSEWAGRIPHLHPAGGTSPTNGPTSGLAPQSPSQLTLSGTTPPPANLAATSNSAFMASIAQLAPNTNSAQPPSSAYSTGHVGAPVHHGLKSHQASTYQTAGGHDETVYLNVHEQAVSYLIGRNGATIADIQNQTGAKVHIARSSGSAANANGTETRKVTISGSGAAVEAAQQMIRQKLQTTRTGGVGHSSQQHTHSVPHHAHSDQ